MAQDYLSSLTQYPYPAVRVDARNPAYARIMLSNIGDQASEASSFALYLYNQTITRADPRLTEAFRAVAEVEKKHLEMLSDAAFQLGADPRLWAVTGNAAQPMRYWSPGLLSYTPNTRSMLQNALALERATIAKYERQAQEIRDDGILLLLRRILLDETMHVDIFRSLLAALDAGAVMQAPPAVQAAPALPPAAPIQPAATALPASTALPPAAALEPPAAIPQQALPPQAQM